MKTKWLLFYILITAASLFTNNCYCQWQQVGPEGGTCKQVWSNGQFVFVSSSNSGLYRSTNNGITFSNLSIPISGRYNFRNFAGIGNTLICCPNTNTNGVYRSTNNGDSWTLVTNGLPSGAYSYSQFLVSNGTNFYYGSSDSGLFKSTDNGLNWVVLNQSIRFDYLGFIGSNLIAHGYRYQPNLYGMIISSDGGSNWVLINNGLPQYFSSYYAIASNATSVFVGIDSSNIGIGVYRTTNNGSNWYAVNNGLTNLRIRNLYTTSNAVYCGTESGIFKSTDNGNIWMPVNNGLIQTICRSINSNGTYIFAAMGSEYTQGGFYYSSNSGNAWNLTNTGIYSQFVIDIMAKGGTLYSAINGSGIWKSLNNGNNWTRINNGLPFTDTSLIRFIDYRGLANDGQNIYCIIRQFPSSIYKSSNDGNNWVFANNGITSSVNCVASSNNNLYAGSDNGINVSSNAGSNWNLIGLNGRYIDGIDISNGTIYACGSGVFQSTNNGNSWDTISGNITGGSEIRVFGTNLFLVRSGQGVYKRSVTGGNWITVNNGITNLGTEKIHIMGQYILVTSHGENDLFISGNEGVSWNNVNQGIKTWINSFTSIGTNVFIGTYGNSVYRRPLSEIIGIQTISSEIPNNFSLSQNYPNPFNPTTQIEFSVPKNNSFVKLTIYNITGREMTKLVNQQLNAGTYKVDFNSENYSSSVYFYKLEAGDFVQTKKMILLK